MNFYKRMLRVRTYSKFWKCCSWKFYLAGYHRLWTMVYGPYCMVYRLYVEVIVFGRSLKPENFGITIFIIFINRHWVVLFVSNAVFYQIMPSVNHPRCPEKCYESPFLVHFELFSFETKNWVSFGKHKSILPQINER